MERKCAFSGTLITHQFGCENAEHVTRRGGPDVACTSLTAQQRCESLFQRMKQVAMPAFGVEDDLLSMPHSVLMKIQFGGLLGLQQAIEKAATAATEVQNVDALIGRALEEYGGMDAIPCQMFVDDMTAYQLKRRRS